MLAVLMMQPLDWDVFIACAAYLVPRAALRRFTCRVIETWREGGVSVLEDLIPEALEIDLGAAAAPAACCREEAVGTRARSRAEGLPELRQLVLVPTSAQLHYPGLCAGECSNRKV